MDYNTPAACDIISYISFNCPKRSDMIMEILVNELDECQNKRSRVFEKMFTAMILIEDDDINVQNRIRNYVSSFKYQSNKGSRGSLLKLAKYTSNTKRIVPYVLKLSSQSKALSKFLSTSRDIHWIIDTLETFLEDEFKDFQLDESIIEEDIKNEFHQFFIGKDISIELFESLPKWRRSEHYFGLVYAYSLVKDKTVTSSNRHVIDSQYQEIEELKKELEQQKSQYSSIEANFDHLKQQNYKLKEIVNYFKAFDNSEVKTLLSKVETEQKIEGIITLNEEEDEEDKRYIPEDEEEEEEETKIDINEKVRSLKEFFGDHLEDEVLIEALQDHNFDINSTANDLFDEDKVNYYRMRCNNK